MITNRFETPKPSALELAQALAASLGEDWRYEVWEDMDGIHYAAYGPPHESFTVTCAPTHIASLRYWATFSSDCSTHNEYGGRTPRSAVEHARNMELLELVEKAGWLGMKLVPE